jgi:predicted Zn-dependent protease
MKRTYLLVLSLILLFPLTSRALTVEEEKKYGKEIYLQIAQSAPINNDPYISLYLHGIMARLESATTVPFPITLTVIESQTINAFATIGGYIYVTTGLIGLCDNEEELAGVMGHELAHITRRHVAKRMEKEKYLNIGMLAAVLAGALVGSPALMVGGMASAQAVALKYSRDDEAEADRVGSTTADKAGYSGMGISEFLKKLRVGGRDTTIPQYLVTHPFHEDRIISAESTWPASKTKVDTAFFPFVAVRANVLHRPPGSGVKEIWLGRYEKDRSDARNAYAASLVYMATGDISDAVKAAGEIRSPYSNLFIGEILVNAKRFGEAIEVLKGQTDPVARLFLAKAYEGKGDGQMAVGTLQGLTEYGPAYPEIYYKLGMISGMAGKEAQGYEYLGRFYMVTGKNDLAKSSIEKAISKYGINSKEAQELLRLLDQIKAQKS